LVIRLSSIGDIVLTTPLLSALRTGLPEAEIHYLTKPAFASLLRYNTNLDRVLTLGPSLWTTRQMVAAENYDFVIDLHKNFRSLTLIHSLGLRSSTIDKQNATKRRMLHGNRRNLAVRHIVTRYGEALHPLGLSLPNSCPLDFPLPPELLEWGQQTVTKALGEDSQAIGAVIGATHATKRWLPEPYADSLNQIGQSVVLLGGPSDRDFAAEMLPLLRVPFLDSVGAHSLLESAALLAACDSVLSHDTGLMHIAAALQKPIVSLWGNTVPEFGFAPWKVPHAVAEVSGLVCRPCSRIGYDACPQGHFRCMRDLSPQAVANAWQTLMNRKA
jgi:ADP-heptose:LPS heptosyltransferase